MKRLNISIAVLGAMLFIVNVFLLITFNSSLDKFNGRLDRLEAKLGDVRSSINSLNKSQINVEAKEKEVFTPSELAQYLGIDMGKIYEMIDAPDSGLPYICIDGEYRFGRDAINEWLKTNKSFITEN